MTPDGEVTQAQLDMLAGGDASQSVGGEPETTSQESFSQETQSQENAAPVTSNTDFLSADSVYENLPDAYRSGKTLDKLIADVNTRHAQALEKYQAYEPFLQISPEELGYAHSIYSMLDSEQGARKLFDALLKTYPQLTPQQAAQAVEEIQQQSQQQEDDFDPETATPEQIKIRELEAQINQFNDFKAQQEERFHQETVRQQNQIFETELDSALSQVYKADPTLSQDQMRNDDLLARVVFAYDNNLKQGGRTPINKIVQDCWNEQRAYNQYLYDKLSNQQPGISRNSQAPLIMSPTGSNPAGSHSYDANDPNARDAEMVRRLQEMQHLS